MRSRSRLVFQYLFACLLHTSVDSTSFDHSRTIRLSPSLLETFQQLFSTTIYFAFAIFSLQIWEVMSYKSIKRVFFLLIPFKVTFFSSIYIYTYIAKIQEQKSLRGAVTSKVFDFSGISLASKHLFYILIQVSLCGD